MSIESRVEVIESLLQIALHRTAGGQGVGDLSQSVWHINRQTGVKTADGLTSATAVDSAAEIARRWAAATPSVFRRIVLPAILITITWDAGALVQPDIADPISVLLDVDGSGGTVLVLQGGGSTVSHTGSLTTVSAFARTAAAGQISITDATVTDFSPYKAQLFHDKTSGAVAALYEPASGSGATGKVTPGRAPMGASQIIKPSPVAYAPGDAYEMLSLTPVYFGTGSQSRMFPTAGPPSASFDIFFYRLWGTSQGTDGFFGDIWAPVTGTSVLGRNCQIFVNECRLDQAYQIAYGNVQFINCALTSTTFQNGVSGGSSSLTMFAGFAYKAPQALLGAQLTLDGDFLVDGNSAVVCSTGSITFVGNFSRWGTSAPAVSLDGGVCHVQNIFESQHVLYGTVGAGNAVIRFLLQQQALQYSSSQTAAQTFQFDSAGPHWVWANGGTTSWGFDAATGRYCGTADGSPAGNTFALLDAALNAPGYGGSSAMAYDPMSASMILVNNG